MKHQFIRYGATAALALLLGATASATTVTSRPLINPATGAVIEGSSSTIDREPDGITVTAHTNLPPGTYTMWLVIWNNPENCVGGEPGLLCLPPPAGGVDVPDTVQLGSGNVAPDSGVVDFGARLVVGDTSGISGGRLRTGLTNPMGAEIHVVLRSHGPVILDMLSAQITTFGGACEVNTCADLQAAGHRPGVPDAHEMSLQQVKRIAERIASRLGIVVISEQ